MTIPRPDTVTPVYVVGTFSTTDLATQNKVIVTGHEANWVNIAYAIGCLCVITVLLFVLRQAALLLIDVADTLLNEHSKPK